MSLEFSTTLEADVRVGDEGSGDREGCKKPAGIGQEPDDLIHGELRFVLPIERPKQLKVLPHLLRPRKLPELPLGLFTQHAQIAFVIRGRPDPCRKGHSTLECASSRAALDSALRAARCQPDLEYVAEGCWRLPAP